MSTVYFKANARIKDVVGRDLINDDNIAVAELVKNAVDAGARNVDIVFDGAVNGSFGPGGDARIIIADNGAGMDGDDIVDKWLNIAYSEKRQAVARGASLAGNKGIGRFSCDRLGEFLRLRAGKGNKFLSLDIDWRKFEVDKMRRAIGKIPLTLHTGITRSEFCEGLPSLMLRGASPLSAAPARPSHGVILEMKKLRSKWDKKKITVLRRLLEKMVNPDDKLLKRRKCLIHVNASELDKSLTGTVENRIFEKLNFEATRAESRITDDGERLETTITDRGQMVARVAVENPYPALRGTHISLYYMNPYKKALFKRATGISTTEFGSVFLFLNGFRVPPYGDRGDDWLSLDNRKTQGVRRFLGARDLLGQIEVRDLDGRNFQVMSSREGIVDNSAFRQLVNVDRSLSHVSYGGYFYDVLGQMEAYVVQGLGWDSLPEDVIGEKAIEKILDEEGEERYKVGQEEKDARILGAFHKIASPYGMIGKLIEVEIGRPLIMKLRKLREEQGGDYKAKILARWERFRGALPKNQGREFDGILREHNEEQQKKIREEQERAKKAEKHSKNERERAEKAEKRAEKAEEIAEAAIKSSKRMFAAARNLNPEMSGVWETIHQMGIKIQTLKFNMRHISAEEMDRSMNDSIRERFHKMRRAVGEIYALHRYLVNRSFADAYTELTGDIPQFLRGYVKELDGSGRVKSFQFSCAPDLTFAAKFSPMDLTIILDNLVDNARKAAKRSKRKPSIRLKASVSEDKGELILRFADDAGGLESSVKDPDAVFDAGFSTTEGMGLGMRIVRDTVEEKMHGKIQCIPAREGVEFEIKIPKR